MRTTVSGSWGTLHVDCITGKVVKYDDEGTLYDSPLETGYSDIVRVDLDEWRRTYPGKEPSHLDVLDVGAWTFAGEYIRPEHEWRADIRGVTHPDEAAQVAVGGRP